MRGVRGVIGVIGVAVLLPQFVTAQEPQPDRSRSATWWSLGATAVPVSAGLVLALAGNGGSAQTAAFATLFWGGALLGPGAGYVHGRAARRALPGLAIRAGAFVVGTIAAPTSDFDDGVYPNPSTEDMPAWTIVTAVIAVSAVVDIVNVSGAVRNNAARRLTVVPLIDPRAGRFGLTFTR